MAWKARRVTKERRVIGEAPESRENKEYKVRVLFTRSQNVSSIDVLTCPPRQALLALRETKDASVFRVSKEIQVPLVLLVLVAPLVYRVHTECE